MYVDVRYCKGFTLYNGHRHVIEPLIFLFLILLFFFSILLFTFENRKLGNLHKEVVHKFSLLLCLIVNVMLMDIQCIPNSPEYYCPPKNE